MKHLLIIILCLFWYTPVHAEETSTCPQNKHFISFLATIEKTEKEKDFRTQFNCFLEKDQASLAFNMFSALSMIQALNFSHADNKNKEFSLLEFSKKWGLPSETNEKNWIETYNKIPDKAGFYQETGKEVMKFEQNPQKTQCTFQLEKRDRPLMAVSEKADFVSICRHESGKISNKKYSALETNKGWFLVRRK